MPKDKAAFSMLGHMQGVWKWFILYILFLVALESMALYFPMFLQGVTEIISEGVINYREGLVYQNQVINDILVQGALVFGFIVLMLIIHIVCEFFVAIFSFRLQKNMRRTLFNKFQRVSSETVEEYGYSKVLPTVWNDTSWTRRYARRLANALVFAPLVVFGSIFMMFRLSTTYSLIALAAVPFILVFFWWRMRKMSKIIPEVVEVFDDYFTNIKEGITGARDIRILGKAEERSEEFGKMVDVQVSQGIYTDRSINLSISFHAILFTIVTVIIILYGVHFNMEVAHDLVILNTILQYVVRMQNGSHTLFAWLVEDAPRYRVSMERANRVMALPERDDSGGITVLPTLAEPRMEFRNITQTHSNGQRSLSDVSISLPFNTRVAIVGGAGSGKNKIPKLLLRKEDVESGVIAVGGIDITSINRMYLRRAVFSYCDQSPDFVPGTIRDNIRVLAPYATDADIMGAFDDLGANDFVARFGGRFLDYEMGERSTLSMGAKNLVNIVRCILKPASFYIFNQCFSHVKPEYINRLMQRLKRERKTCLFITYAQEICRACNNVYVLKNGRVGGMGSHRELLATNADYNKFYAAFGASIINEADMEGTTAPEPQLTNDGEEIGTRTLEAEARMATIVDEGGGV